MKIEIPSLKRYVLTRGWLIVSTKFTRKNDTAGRYFMKKKKITYYVGD